jgi:sugar-specific transcriptional regulator TrmB
MQNSLERLICSEEFVQLFSILGISRFGCEVYLRLLLEGPLTLSELSERLGAKASQIYYYIKELVSKGLVEVSRGRPTLYKAVSPSILEKLYLEKLEFIRDNVIKRLKTIVPVERKIMVEEPLVYVVKNWKTFLLKAREVANDATKNLIVCGDFEFVNYLSEIAELKEKEGVNTYILLYEVPGITIDYSNLPRVRKLRKYVSGDLMVIADSRIAVLSQRRRGINEKPSYGLIIEEPVIIDHIEQDFFYKWIRSEIIRDEPVKLPTSFTVLRLAIYETLRLRQSKCKIRVLVYGKYVKSGVNCVVEGDLLDSILENGRGIAQLIIRVDGNIVSVGSQDAVIEDIAASIVELRGVC